MVRVNAGGPWLEFRLQAAGSVAVGLSDREIFSVARFAAGIPGRWLVEYHQDYDGEASALLFPACGHDMALLFHRDGVFLHLDAIDDDDHEYVASAPRIELLFPAAEARLFAWMGGAPGSRKRTSSLRPSGVKPP
jgi:hypothetical protein